MSKPKLKVCGITTLQDALAIEALGVEYLGFNFIPESKRYISPENAKVIIENLTTATPVGIFMDQERSYIESTIATSGITLVQLHGDESPALCNAISVPVIKVFSIINTLDQTILENYNTAYFLFDTQVGVQKGGTGSVFDWRSLNKLTQQTPYFLAGGLGPDNVVEAFETTNAFALDLNSKVEFSPGLKNISLLKNCISQLDA